MIKQISKESTTVYTISLTQSDLILLLGSLSIALESAPDNSEARNLLEELKQIN